MPRAFCISVTFVTGRYHGAEYPPSPARLHQAMLAGVMTGGYRALRPRVEPGLRWLERQPPPHILAAPARLLRQYRLAVPNNDMDAVAREWAAGRPANPSELRTMKRVEPRGVEAAGPHVRYLWKLEEEDPPLESLRPLAHCLHTLGWGVDMSFADTAILEAAPPGADYEYWQPSRTGEPLAVPVAGFLDDLDATYRRFTGRAAGAGIEADTRPSVYRLQGYARAGSRAPRYEVLGLRKPDRDEDYSHAWEWTMHVAAWLRHAAATALAQEGFERSFIDSYVHGHMPAGSDASHRMSFVPLPSIGHEHAGGRIRRVMLVEPAGSDGAVTRLLGAKLPGWEATDNKGRLVCCFARLADRRAVVRWYTDSARRWRSVTPVVLHGYNSVRRRISVEKTERLLWRAFEMAGYSESSIQRLAFQTAPLWNGTGAAPEAKTPPHLDGFPRYHVEVEFRAAVAGPVLAGIGRHCGLGVFGAAEP